MKFGLILCKCFITYPNSVSVLISFAFNYELLMILRSVFTIWSIQLLCTGPPCLASRLLCYLPFFTHGRCMLSSICESLRAHSNCVDFNQAALRAVLKPENMSSSTQATQIPVRFVCVYASSTLPFIAVFNRFSRCLDHGFRSFPSLFKSISIDYKTLELNYFLF